MGRGEEPRLHNPRDMGFLHSFIARVREEVVAGNPSNEFEKVVALKQSSVAAYIVMRRTPRANLDDRRKSGAALSQYPVRSCVKITPWNSVEREGTMAVHFEKHDIESKEVRNARRSGKIANSRRSPKTGRTKVTIVSFRRWSVEHATAVKEIWEMLNDAAEKNQLERVAERPKVFSDQVTLQGSVVDEKTRMKERRQLSEDHRMLANVSRSSFGRLSQGQKMMKAMAMRPQQRDGRYSALARAATGERSFSQSLIGSPNLKDFDKKPANPRREPKVGIYRIEEDLTDRSQLQPGKEASGAPEVSLIDGSLTPVQTVRKRRREATSADVAAKRKKYLTEQFKRHKVSSHTANPRRMLRSSMQSISGPYSPYPDIVNGCGIANEGNTCYLSAVVQALMCDGDLIARVRKRIQQQGTTSMPFSSALANMAKSRESFKILKAGQIRDAISKHFPQFSSSDQQDAHEFFLRCLDVIGKECTLGNFRDSPTHTNYSLVQERKFTCTLCGHQTKPRREILRGLSLDIPQKSELSYLDGEQSPLSVEDLVRNFFSSQDLVLDCESCDGKNAKSDTNIVLPPRSLVLHIKRFGVDYLSENGTVSIKKISDRISIPERISLDSFLAQTACSSDVMESAAKVGDFDVDCPRNVTPTGIDERGKSFSDPSSRPIATSFPPLKSQALSHLPQLLSPADARATKRPRATKEPFNFARRFRVHADEPKDRRHTDGRVFVERSRSKCRNLQVCGEEIEEDNKMASIASNGLERGPESTEHAKAIMALGIPERQAETILQEANYDVTRAMGLAMDRRQELCENPKDLDEDLLKCIAPIKKDRLLGAPFGAKTARYKLTAVIRHHSDTTDRGHYVADVLQQDGSWFCYDDSSVFKMNSTKLQDQEGYLCWYIAV